MKFRLCECHEERKSASCLRGHKLEFPRCARWSNIWLTLRFSFSTVTKESNIRLFIWSSDVPHTWCAVWHSFTESEIIKGVQICSRSFVSSAYDLCDNSDWGVCAVKLARKAFKRLWRKILSNSRWISNKNLFIETLQQTPCVKSINALSQVTGKKPLGISSILLARARMKETLLPDRIWKFARCITFYCTHCIGNMLLQQIFKIQSAGRHDSTEYFGISYKGSIQINLPTICIHRSKNGSCSSWSRRNWWNCWEDNANVQIKHAQTANGALIDTKFTCEYRRYVEYSKRIFWPPINEIYWPLSVNVLLLSVLHDHDCYTRFETQVNINRLE